MVSIVPRRAGEQYRLHASRSFREASARPTNLAALSLEQLVRHVESIPPLPDTALAVLRLTDDPMISTRQIAATISDDLAFTSRILTIANSAFYGMPRAIGTVNEAVQVLGMRTLRSLAMAAAT